MHHYGVFRTSVSYNNFNITLKNKISGAEINISGPIEGLFEDRFQRISENNVKRLASLMAEFFMERLSNR